MFTAIDVATGCEFFCSGKTHYVGNIATNHFCTDFITIAFVGIDVNVTATEIVVALEAGQIKFAFMKVFMTMPGRHFTCCFCYNSQKT